jgi:hypothetical protein
MAPRLAASQHDMITDMIASKSLKAVDMAAAAGCSDRTIRNIRSNLRCFGSSRAPFNGGGRCRQITPVMLEALRERLLEKPGMYTLMHLQLPLCILRYIVIPRLSLSRLARALL